MQRREFIKYGLAAAVAPTIVPRHVLGGQGYVAPSARVTLGGVGIGGVGHGQIRPPSPKELNGEPLPYEGVLYIGTKGKMLSSGLTKEIRILDPALDAKAKSIPRTMRRRGDIWKEWLDACRGGEKAGCDFEWAKLVTEFVLLGNLAVRTGRPVAFDPEAFRVRGNDAADALLRLKYFNGWGLGA